MSTRYWKRFEAAQNTNIAANESPLQQQQAQQRQPVPATIRVKPKRKQQNNNVATAITADNRTTVEEKEVLLLSSTPIASTNVLPKTSQKRRNDDAATDDARPTKKHRLNVDESSRLPTQCQQETLSQQHLLLLLLLRLQRQQCFQIIIIIIMQQWCSNNNKHYRTSCRHRNWQLHHHRYLAICLQISHTYLITCLATIHRISLQHSSIVRLQQRLHRETNLYSVWELIRCDQILTYRSVIRHDLLDEVRETIPINRMNAVYVSSSELDMSFPQSDDSYWSYRNKYNDDDDNDDL